MNTQNIISTPDITGNIGSCTTKAERVVTNEKIFKTKGFTVITNSCTGVAEKVKFDVIGYVPAMFIIGIGIFICARFFIWVLSDSN